MPDGNGKWLDSADIGTFPNTDGEAARTPGDSQDPGDGFGVFPVHASLLHTGKVLLWSGHYEVNDFLLESWTWDPFGGSDPYQVTGGESFQPFSPTHGRDATLQDAYENGFDIFCAHHVFLEDGRLLVVGGDRPTPSGDTEHTNDTLHVFDPADETWSKVEGTMVGGRWYPTAVVMPDGRVTIFSGHSDDGDNTEDHILGTVEVVDPPESDPDLADYDPAAVTTNVDKYLPTYPGLHLVPGGELFYTGTSWEYPDPEPPQTASFRMTGTDTGRWRDYTDAGGDPLYPDDRLREEGTSVLLPPAQAGRILLVGGARATFSGRTFTGLDGDSDPDSWEILDTQGDPEWVASGSMAQERINLTTVLLPDGTVLILGGHDEYKFDHDPGGHAMTAELFDPEAALDDDPTTDPITETGEMAEARMYHSVALLLPDGSVFVAGGDDDHADATTPGEPEVGDQKNYEIYRPPYFYDGTRPESIVGAISRDDGPDGEIHYGGRFTIETADAPDIAEVVLMRPGSITHHTDTEQRHVPQSIVGRGDTELTVEVTNDPTVAPPGYYMVFTVDAEGRPCERAEFVRLSHRHCELATDRSHFSEDAVPADGTTFDDSFYLVLDGFTPQELDITTYSPTPGQRSDVAPAITFEGPDGASVDAMEAYAQEIIFEDESQPLNQRQRVTFRFGVEFTGNGVFFDADDEPIERQEVTITADADGYTCDGDVTLIHQPNPFMLDGPTHWLSVDVRVFQVRAGEHRFGVSLSDSDPDPTGFIQSVLGNFNADDGPDFDEDLATGQEASALELSRSVDGTRVFNFAVAQVRYRGRTLAAEDVRVFFRMFPTASTSLDYRPDTTYRTHEAADGRVIPLLGTKDEEVISIPFFAEPRVGTVGPGGESMEAQTDEPNVRTIPPAASDEAVREYFGCWLDFNQTTERFPVSPSPGDDGPYDADADLRSIQELIRGRHQCLVAEINFDPDPTTPDPAGTDQLQPGDSPADSDNLSQRNLAIVESENPGGPATRSVQHTFDLKPTTHEGVGQTADARLAAAATRKGPRPQRPGPDELMLLGTDVPAGTTATLYLPALDAEAIVHHAAMRGGPRTLEVVDPHTVRCTLDGAAYVPLLADRPANVAGLLTVELPDGVREGQTFRVRVTQRSRRRGRIEGTFELQIPVRSGDDLLPGERRRLAVFKHIAQSIPPGSRWYAIFQQRLQHGADRVAGLGGDPTAIEASPDGVDGDAEVTPEDRAARRLAGAAGGAGALFVASLAALGTGAGAALTGLLGLVAVGAIAVWNARERPSRCQQLLLYLVSASVGTAVLALLVVAGLASTGALIAAALLVGVLVVLALAFGCLRPWRP